MSDDLLSVMQTIQENESAEETSAQEVETEVQETLTPAQSRTIKVEEQARNKGWKPLEEFEGDPEQWRPAELFIALEPFYKDVKALKKDKKELQKALEDLGQHHSKVREMEYKRALEDLKAEKKRALLDLDVDKVQDLDDQIDELKESNRTVKAESKQVQQEVPAEFVEFTNRNSWYGRNKAMSAFADAYGLAYHQENNPTPAELFSAIEKEVKKRYAEEFTARPKVSAVDSGAKAAAPAAKKSDTTLTQEEKQVLQNFMRLGVINDSNKEEYIKRVVLTRKQ